jgi:hypothetical protein
MERTAHPENPMTTEPTVTIRVAGYERRTTLSDALRSVLRIRAGVALTDPQLLPAVDEALAKVEGKAAALRTEHERRDAADPNVFGSRAYATPYERRRALESLQLAEDDLANVRAIRAAIVAAVAH